MTPSYVDFNDKERLIGDATKNQVARNPTYSIFGIHPILQSPNLFFFVVVNFFFLFYLLQLPKLTITNKIDLAQVVCGLIIDGLASSWIGFRFKVKKKKTNLTQPNRTWPFLFLVWFGFDILRIIFDEVGIKLKEYYGNCNNLLKKIYLVGVITNTCINLCLCHSSICLLPIVSYAKFTTKYVAKFCSNNHYVYWIGIKYQLLLHITWLSKRNATFVFTHQQQLVTTPHLGFVV